MVLDSTKAYLLYIKRKKGGEIMRNIEPSKYYDSIFSGYSDVVGVKDICKMLGVGRRTVYRLIKRGRLPAIPGIRSYKVSKFRVIDYVLNESKKF